MDFTTYFSTMLEEHSLPCCIADIESEEILYINLKMKELLVDYEHILGKKFHEIISSDDNLFQYRVKMGESTGEHFEAKVYDKKLNKEFIASHTQVEFQGQFYILCKYRIICGENGENCTNIISFEDAMTQCVSILQQEEALIVPSFLALLSSFYETQYTCFYRFNGADKSITWEVGWGEGGQLSTVPDSLDIKVDFTQVLSFLETRNEVGILEADNRYETLGKDSIDSKILESFNLKNIVLSVLENAESEVTGVIVMCNRKELSIDYRLLQGVTEFIRQIITKSEPDLNLCQITQMDMLTGFSGRTSYSYKVEEYQKNLSKSMGVVLANVNGLKQVNSEFGYAKGDSYIRKAARLVKMHFKEEFFRISGDEFVAFFPDVEKKEFEMKVKLFHQKMKKQNEDCVAIGLAWGDKRFNLVNLIQEAETVMYINKQEYYHYSNRRFEDVGDRTLSDLLSYLDNDEFMVYLQPQFHLKDNSFYGAEALIRRFDKTNQKMVFPDQFIPMYEKKSVIRHVDIFVVKKVCQLLQEWSKVRGYFPISVNLSRVTLLEFGIVETIAKICDKYQVPHNMLVIEVTERVGLIENNVASSLITEFVEHGFHISLDDFGCAYSNIVTLAQISVNEVKIDKSLIDFLVTNEKNRVLVKNVLTMCNELENTSTLAEGIEYEEQANLLREYHCHLGQGYLYSRPVPLEEFFDKYVK